uniref:Kazal-like domain-containing protein n=1 Tax=Megaselia scalaris TaxID=36166 RepID=T1GE32_MEGSC
MIKFFFCVLIVTFNMCFGTVMKPAPMILPTKVLPTAILPTIRPTLPTKGPILVDPKPCNRVCNSKVIQRISAQDLWTGCPLCFLNDCEFVRAQCQFPRRYMFSRYDFCVYTYVPCPFRPIKMLPNTNLN